MTMQKSYPRSNLVQAPEKNEKSLTEIDRQLRDFVLQDTARLRSEAETAPKPVLRLEPEGVAEVITEINSLVQQVAGITVDQVDDVVADFRAALKRCRRPVWRVLVTNEWGHEVTDLPTPSQSWATDGPESPASDGADSDAAVGADAG